MADQMPSEPEAPNEFPIASTEHAPLPSDEVAPGLVPGPEDDIGEISEEHGFRLRRGNESGWFSCLSAFDSNFAQGYHDETIKRLGGGKFAGLRTEAQLSIGQYTTSTITIRYRVRNANRLYTVLTAVVPLDNAEEGVNVETVKSTNPEGIVDALFKIPSAPIDEDLRDGSNACQDTWVDILQQPWDGEPEGAVTKSFPATFLQRGVTHFRIISLDIPRKSIKIVHSKELDRPNHLVPDGCRRIHDALVTYMDNLQGVVPLHVVFRVEESFTERWEPKIANLRQWASPYAPFIEKIRDEVSDLTFDNFVINGVTRPEFPASPGVVFTSNEHRTVSLIGSVVEEVDFLRDCTTQLFNKPLQVAVIRDPFSTWDPQPNDEQRYGIIADGSPTHQYFVLPCGELSNLLPDTGDRCRFYLPGVDGQRSLPQVTLTADDVNAIVREMVSAIDAAYDMSVDAGDDASDSGDNQAEVFTSAVQRLITPYLQHPSDDVLASIPDEDKAVQLAMTSITTASDIVAAFQDPATFRNFLQNWVQKYAGRQVEHPSGRGEPWHATRIALPSGTRADIALFSVRTPHQHDWPTHWQSPPVHPKLPTRAVKGRVGKFLQDLAEEFTAGAVETVEVNLWYEVDEETAKTECAAITDMNAVPKTSRAAAFWKHTLDFQARPPPMNLLATFPTLQSAFENGEFRGEHATVMENLQDSNGYTFVDGGPGSGKSTFGVTICKAIMDGKKKIAWIAPSNALVRDACERLKKNNPDKTVRRMLPWAAEMGNLTTIPPEPRLIPTEKRAATADMTLAKHTNALATARFEAIQPSKIASSISALAQQLATTHKADWDDFLRGVDELRNDPVEYATNIVEHRATARDLLGHTIMSCDAVCTTPVAFTQMMKHMPDLEFALIVVDEAGRLSENLSLISVSKCPHTPHLFIGDNEQFAPISLLSKDPTVKDFFSPQRSLSLFKRIDTVGAMTATLRINHRAHGMVADWAANYLYNGELIIDNKTSSAAPLPMRKWLKKAVDKRKASSSVFVIEVAEAEEVPVGTSFANPVNARFGRELIAMVYREAPLRDARDVINGVDPARFGSTLVIVGYSAQKNEWDGVMRELSPAEVPLDRVEVRTIDDSPSHEADLVICDLTRTEKPGFLKERERLAVLATRARVALIILGTPRCTHSDTHLGNLFQYVDTRNAYIKIRAVNPKASWIKFCDRCAQHGHWKAECKYTPKCPLCKVNRRPSDHALRYCPHAKDKLFPNAFTLNPVPSDGIFRDPFHYEASSEGKRAKFRKAARRSGPEPSTGNPKAEAITRHKTMSRLVKVDGLDPDVVQKVLKALAEAERDIEAGPAGNEDAPEESASAEVKTAPVGDDFAGEAQADADTWGGENAAADTWGNENAAADTWGDENAAADTCGDENMTTTDEQTFVDADEAQPCDMDDGAPVEDEVMEVDAEDGGYSAWNGKKDCELQW